MSSYDLSTKGHDDERSTSPGRIAVDHRVNSSRLLACDGLARSLGVGQDPVPRAAPAAASGMS